jgi:hypothetical protein
MDFWRYISSPELCLLRPRQTALNRLATATGNFGSSTFAYDGVGNRVSDVNTLSAVTKTRAFTTATTSNRLSTITENAAAFRSYIIRKTN